MGTNEGQVRMRVLLEAASLSLSSGGLARYTSELSLALARCFSEDEFILASDQPFEMPPGPPANWLDLSKTGAFVVYLGTPGAGTTPPVGSNSAPPSYSAWESQPWS